MGGGKSSSSKSQRIQYAKYLEAAHKAYLNGNDGKNLLEAFNAAWDNSPYTEREALLVEKGYLGEGWTIENFPSLFDMFGKFMAGLDVETLWTQEYNATVQGSEVDDLIAAYNQETIDNMQEKAYPTLHAGMRNIGSINSSAFVVGRSLLEAHRAKDVGNFSAKLKMQMVQMAHERWKTHLDWNRAVITTYADLMKTYYVAVMDADKLNYQYKETDALWNLNLFDYTRSMLGALSGAAASSGSQKGPSKVQSALGGAMSGAAAGAMVSGGNPIGAVVGGTLGLIGGLF